MSDPSYKLTKATPLAISPQLFHSKLKTLLFNNHILINPFLPTFLPISTPNTIHHSHLTICLPDSGSHPLPIDFVLDKRLCLSWFLQLRFCGCCRNLEFTITIRVAQDSIFIVSQRFISTTFLWGICLVCLKRHHTNDHTLQGLQSLEKTKIVHRD